MAHVVRSFFDAPVVGAGSGGGLLKGIYTCRMLAVGVFV